MKKLVLLVVLLAVSSASYARTYKCWRYFEGHPSGTWIKVSADSKDEAESIAYVKMKKIDARIDYASCK